MYKSAVEMEDTENHPYVSRSYVKESRDNCKEEKSPPAISVEEDTKERENGEQDPDEPGNESLAIAVEQKAIETVAEINFCENKQLPKSSSDEDSLSQKCNMDEEMDQTVDDDDGTPEEQVTFMKELETFHRERAMEFKPLKFCGEPLNFLKLWRVVMRLGGYGRGTVTEGVAKATVLVLLAFHGTCTTIYWTFRVYYEKHVLEYERHKTQSSGLQVPGVMSPESEASGVDSKRRRGSDSIEQKIPNAAGHSIKTARTERSKQLRLLTGVVDVGLSADWVKINVRKSRNCFKVYGLIPGLLCNEVRVQSDPAGRVIIMGQPQKIDHLWGITPFQKIIRLPARIDPRRTSAFMNQYGRLYVIVPFEQPS
ncbi:AT-rich interactive domain-containing protein 5-like [Dorcoceras hygrometricum]|uniref:AT-rich interactive domain-containing protein 5-like n=1 Tax=Dorcoceras hygrometricum TaxID=472368 RepID=A0A2Z7ANA0_9LAMI|nr:AT-rich interactive domain-containing protein 5-like [Dorcoceras hygrometricum]